VHNNGVSYFEDCLTSGGLLFQEERRALYKYLLEINKDFYFYQANLLLDQGTTTRSIANGEATYFLKDGKVNYSARQLNSEEIQVELREIKLTRIRKYNIRILKKFFAQCDVDVISNFPIPGPIQKEESGYGFNTYPFYSLAYYANGRNYLKGIVNKLRTKDNEILTKLRTL
jgi:hypothetical protein